MTVGRLECACKKLELNTANKLSFVTYDLTNYILGTVLTIVVKYRKKLFHVYLVHRYIIMYALFLNYCS